MVDYPHGNYIQGDFCFRDKTYATPIGLNGRGRGSKMEKEGRLMSAGCLRMIHSQLTSDQPCHQQESAEEKDESGA